MLKIVLVAHLTYENQWGEYENSDFCSFGDTLLCIPLCLSLSCWCRSLETQLHREQSWCFPFEFVDKIAHIVRSVEIDNIPCIPSSLKVIQTKVIQNLSSNTHLSIWEDFYKYKYNNSNVPGQLALQVHTFKRVIVWTSLSEREFLHIAVSSILTIWQQSQLMVI